jgi:hypothetical protein
MSYMASGLSGSVNISVTYLGIRQEVRHGTLNCTVGLNRVSYHLHPEYRSATTTPENLLSSRRIRTSGLAQ